MPHRLRLIALAFTCILASFTAPANAVAASPDRTSIAGAVDTGRWCDFHTYAAHYAVSVADVSPRLTNLSRHTLPPSAWHKETRSSSWQVTLRSAVHFSTGTSISVSGISKILGKASAQTNLDLRASGSATYQGSIQVTSYVSNPTGQSVTFPFYKGWSYAKGQFRYYFCEQQTNTYPRQWHVFYRPGSWHSYAAPSDGAVRCGDRTTRLDSVARLALRLGCA